jgi:hypothetical protein
MAGSLKWFIYDTDDGTQFAIKLDESNTESVNAGSNDFLNNSTLKFALPRNIRPRYALYQSADGTRTVRCVALTPTIYTGIPGNIVSIVDPIVPTQNLFLKRIGAEKISLPFGADTGIDDGDAD